MCCLSFLLLLPLARSLAFLLYDYGTPQRGYHSEYFNVFDNRTHYEKQHSISSGSSSYQESETHRIFYNDVDSIDYEEDQQPLLLTPYIEEGRIEEGREAARVPPLLGDIQSYSGYFTVNKEYISNLFFWYFPAEETIGGGKSVPVILWLNGGPGVTSLYGLVYENGPVVLQDDNTLAKRSTYWSKHYHMIYVDNPVGVGFSFTNTEGLAHNEIQLSREMHTALVQFFQLFPDLSKNDFFIAGESYAGRYIPSIACEIHESNPTSKVHINLKGVMIGNGMVDPDFSENKGMLLSQLGFIDKRLLPERLKAEEAYVKALKSRDYATASLLQARFNTELASIRVNSYNYIDNNNPLSVKHNMDIFFNNSLIRKHIHVGNVMFSMINDKINGMISLGDKFMETSPYIETLLEHYRVLYYNGQLDLMLPYPNCDEYTETLNWSGASEYRNAARNEWSVGGKLAGFSRAGGNLTLVLVRNAGHMVPMDQPEMALDLITKFINDKPVV